MADALHAVETGIGPPVVMVHGFTQTHRSWRPISERLGHTHRVTLVDAPGHGGSSDLRADLWRGAELVAAVGGRAAYVGYSMGARICLHLALSHPELVTRLVLVGAHPGISDPAERARRHRDDDALAGRIEARGVCEFVDWWLQQPLFETLAAPAAGRDDRLTNTVDGLASSLRLAGTGRQDPLWDRLGELAMPVLVVAGERDAKFAQLGHQMVQAIGANSEVVLIPGAGHACHLEYPDAFAEILAAFLVRGSHSS